MGDFFLDKTWAVLNKVLDGASSRQRVLADNIANVETPGYTRKVVNFESSLREQISQDDPDPDRAIAGILDSPIALREDTLSPRRGDGNNVDIDREMVEVAKNSLQYESTAQLLILKLRELRTAIHEGRR